MNCYTRAVVLDSMVDQCEKAGIDPMEGAEWEEEEEEMEEEEEEERGLDLNKEIDDMICNPGDPDYENFKRSKCTCDVCAEMNGFADTSYMDLLARNPTNGYAGYLNKVKEIEQRARDDELFCED